MGEKYYIVKSDGSEQSVELKLIGGDVTSGEFPTGDSNERLVDAKKLIVNCSSTIKKQIGNVYPGLFFVYRLAAIGGMQRNLGQFTSKPLTVKAKSIDPQKITVNEAFRRLSGLVPIQKALGKGGGSGEISYDTGTYIPWFVRKVEDVGNIKYLLYFDDHKNDLEWIQEGSTQTTGKTLCTFLGDSYPILADWDLVTVGITKNSVKKDVVDKLFVVKDYKASGSPMHNILPIWLNDCINSQGVSVQNHVTQHGPESLYCGNDIQNEKFLLLKLAASSDAPSVTKVEATPCDKWTDTQSEISKMSNYFFYQFEGFDGTSKSIDYDTSIGNVNVALGNIAK